MKKAKFILTAIGVLAVAGGALAFKAHKFTQLKVYKLNAQETSCTFLKSYNPSVVGQPTLTITKATITNAIPALTECVNTVRVRSEGI